MTTQNSEAWQSALLDMLRQARPEVDGVIVDPPYVLLIVGDTAHRYWMPETLGPVKAGPITFRAVPPNGLRVVSGDD